MPMEQLVRRYQSIILFSFMFVALFNNLERYLFQIQTVELFSELHANTSSFYAGWILMLRPILQGGLSNESKVTNCVSLTL